MARPNSDVTELNARARQSLSESSLRTPYMSYKAHMTHETYCGRQEAGGGTRKGRLPGQKQKTNAVSANSRRSTQIWERLD
ncbi:MAG: hypothetical protein QOH31_554 [Verrucomicrobiota bacterium]|jgi:hypothetical protein